MSTNGMNLNWGKFNFNDVFSLFTNYEASWRDPLVQKLLKHIFHKPDPTTGGAHVSAISN